MRVELEGYMLYYLQNQSAVIIGVLMICWRDAKTLHAYRSYASNHLLAKVKSIIWISCPGPDSIIQVGQWAAELAELVVNRTRKFPNLNSFFGWERLCDWRIWYLLSRTVGCMLLYASKRVTIAVPFSIVLSAIVIFLYVFHHLNLVSHNKKLRFSGPKFWSH